MEEESEQRGDSTQSGMTYIQGDTLTHSCSHESDEQQKVQEEQEEEEEEEDNHDNQADSMACDGQVVSSQESLIATNTQDSADCLPWSPLLSEEELTPPMESSHPSNTQNRPSEPCWYCLRSLDSEHQPETPQQEDSDPLSPLPSSGQKVSYQTDPRPHFGVAWSSHSTCRPLWGSEGPCWGQRNQEAPDQTHTCPHCHLGLPPDTLRWHEAKCLLFEGLRSSKK